MARKPLIDPNALTQGGSTPLSTISRIIQKDREASGRGAGEAEPSVNETTSEQDNQLTGQQPQQLAGSPDNQLTDEAVNQLTSEPVSQSTGSPVNSQNEKEPQAKANRRTSEPVNNLTPKDRRRKAEEAVEAMAQTPAKQIGPRIPKAWDDWLEDYVHVRRDSGLQKQELIKGLIRDFIVNELAKQEGED